jgi:ribosome assembly protein YihI (activator of Der GTPase)
VCGGDTDRDRQTDRETETDREIQRRKRRGKGRGRQRGTERQRERERTHQHHLYRVCHDPHIGFEDVIVECWCQQPTMLEPLISIQKEQTMSWARIGYMCDFRG